MIFSKRLKLAEEFKDWKLRHSSQELSKHKDKINKFLIPENAFNVITFLDSSGYLREKSQKRMK